MSIIKIANDQDLHYDQLIELNQTELENVFGSYKNTKERNTNVVIPDYPVLAKELAKPGVTMQLLWEEYVDQYKNSDQMYYRLTQFKKYFRDYLSQHSYTNIIHHKAVERVQVDWAGERPQWVDPDTDEVIKGYLFVAVLPFSGYGFSYCFSNMKKENWIEAHIKLFNFLGCVPLLTVPDNLKTGVTKHSKSEVILNQSYEDLANHYHTVIMPARVKHSKDKGAVENTVKWFTTNLIARMRNYRCFSLEEYNDYLQIELNKLNAKPFQKKEGSRSIVFNELEKNVLQQLPHYSYQYCEFKTAKVYSNSHISVAKHYYSVPYQFIGKSVQLKIYADHLDVFDHETLLCSHSTKYVQAGGYSTDESHLPPDSSHYGTWNSSRYLQWARRIGPNVGIVVELIFQQGPEQQYYQRVHSLLKLADRSSDKELDRACQLALERNSTPSYSFVKSILKKLNEYPSPQSNTSDPEQSFMRGADYYDKHNF